MGCDGEIMYDESLHSVSERETIENWLTGDGDLLQMDRNRCIVKSAFIVNPVSYDEAQLALLGIFLPPNYSWN
jgi:hypothetical protein